METDIITALKGQLFNILDVEGNENEKLFPLGGEFNQKIIFNGEVWDLGEIQGEGEIPVLVKNEAEKFTKAFEEVKNKLDKEENVRKLAEMERIEQQIREAEENKARDTERKEKTYEHRRPFQKPNIDLIKPKESNSTMLDMIYSYVGNDVLEIFGETGSLKTKMCLKATLEASEAGKKIYYLDAERNLDPEYMKTIKGCTYEYTPKFDEVCKKIKTLGHYDIVIIDSIGLPALIKFARCKMNEKGQVLLDLIAALGDLKVWAYENNALVIVVNQPESDFNKTPGQELGAFGDKSQFATKVIWKTELIESRPNLTTSKIKSFRSRDVGRGTLIATVKVSNSGVEVVQA